MSIFGKSEQSFNSIRDDFFSAAGDARNAGVKISKNRWNFLLEKITDEFDMFNDFAEFYSDMYPLWQAAYSGNLEKYDEYYNLYEIQYPITDIAHIGRLKRIDNFKLLSYMIEMITENGNQTTEPDEPNGGPLDQYAFADELYIQSPEKDNKVEKRLYQVLSKYVHGDIKMFQKNPEMANLLQQLSHGGKYPGAFQDVSGYLYRGIAASRDWLKNYVDVTKIYPGRPVTIQPKNWIYTPKYNVSSWSTEFDIATQFAMDNVNHDDPYIITMTTEADVVSAVSLDNFYKYLKRPRRYRDEREIICFGDVKVKNVNIRLHPMFGSHLNPDFYTDKIDEAHQWEDMPGLGKRDLECDLDDTDLDQHLRDAEDPDDINDIYGPVPPDDETIPGVKIDPYNTDWDMHHYSKWMP